MLIALVTLGIKAWRGWRQPIGRSALTGERVRALDSMEEDGLRGCPHMIRNIFVCEDLQQEAMHIRNRFLLLSLTLRGLGNPVNRPRLRTLGSQTTASHTLGLSSIEGARDTTDGDVSG